MNITQNYKGGSGEEDSSSLFASLSLVGYILLKYPIKYLVLYYLFMIIMFLLRLMVIYGCTAYKYFTKFFKAVTKPGKINLILFKLPDIFGIFIGFLNLFIALLYAALTFLILIAVGCVTLPFNIIFSL